MAGGPECDGDNNHSGATGVAVDRAGNVYFTAGSKVCLRNPDGEISLFAGSGAYGYFGDGGPATTADLNAPSGLLLDSAGNLYIADYFNSRVRKVSADGKINTVAGNGAFSYSGDGGAATSAALNRPTAIALDTAGNLFIADSANNRIRMVAPNGIISTVAGNGTLGFRGVGGAATAAQLSGPGGVAVDSSGNLYIADTNNNRILKVGSDGKINTIAGEIASGYSGDGGLATAAQLFFPQGVVVDSLGNVLIADGHNSRIRKVDKNGIITTIAGNPGAPYIAGDGGPAVAAQLGNPEAITFDYAGNLYIADPAALCVRKIDTSGMISTVVGSGAFGMGTAGDGGLATAAELQLPNSMAADGLGNLYIADTHNHAIRKITADGVIRTIAGQNVGIYGGDGGPATKAWLYSPQNVAFDTSGNIYIADQGNNRIRKISSDGTISTVAGNGNVGYAGDGGLATLAQLSYPSWVATDTAGNMFIADTNNHRIRKVNTNGIITTVAGMGTSGFSGDGGTATMAQLNSPAGVAIDAAGNLYIADTNNNRIREVLSNSTIVTLAGNGTKGYSGDGGNAADAQLASPNGVAVDTAGNLYIADMANHRIRKVAANGTISTTAGNGMRGYRGNNSPAATAELNFPGGVALDSAGNLYIADTYNNLIRKVSKSGFVPLNPVRLLDTRSGALTVDGLFQGQGMLPKLGQIDLTVLGRGGMIASEVDAVVLNVTVTNPIGVGYATVWPAGSTLPNASNLNYVAGDTVANLVVVKLGTNNQVSLFSHARTDMIADVVGYFVSGSDLTSFAPERLLDTRAGNITLDGQDAGIGAVGPNGILTLPIAGRGSVPASGAGSVILNLTATAPTTLGYITAWSGDVTHPLASTLNFLPGQTVPNLVIGKLSSTGGVSFFNSAGTTDLIADVTAWLPENAELTPLTPARLLDTRIGAGNTTIDGQSQGTGRLQAATPFDLMVAGRGGVPLTGANAVILNVTVTNPGATGFLQVWPSGSTRPNASNLNYVSGQTVANLAIAKVGVGGKVSLFSNAKTDAIVDVVGWLQ